MSSQVEALIKLGIDEGTAQQAVAAIRGIQTAANNASQQLVKTGRDMREMGAMMSMAGAAIIAPIVAAANSYAQKFGALETSSRAYLAAQNNMTKATDDFGRVAAQAMAPILNTLAALLEKVAQFAAANPDLMKLALGAGVMLASLGATITVAGQVITTVGKAQDFIKTALAGQSQVLGDFLAVIGKVAVGLAALYVGVNAGVALVQLWGKATGDQTKANYSMSDAMNTGSQIVVIFSKALTDGIDAANKIWALVRVGALEMVNGLLTGIDNFIKSIEEAIASIMDFLQTHFNIGGGGGSINTQGSADLENQISDNQQTIADILSKTQDQVTQNDKNFADWAKSFMGGGGLQGLGQSIITGISDILQGKMPGSAGTVQGSGGGANGSQGGLSPDAVNAFIDYQKQMQQSNLQFQQDKLQAQVDFQRSSKQAQVAYQQDLAQSAIDYQRKQADTTRQFNQDQAQAERDYQKTIADEDRQYNLSKTQANVAFQRTEAEAQRTYQESLTQQGLDYQRQQIDAQTQFNNDRAQLELDYQRQQADTTVQRKDQDVLDARDHQHRLQQLAMSGDVMGYIQEQQQYQFDQQTKVIQRSQEDQQKQTQYQQQLDDQQHQYDLQNQQAAIDNQRKLDDMQTQYDNEEQQRQIAYQQSLDDLQTQHDNVLQSDQIAYQQQLSALQLKYQQDQQTNALAYQQELQDKRTSFNNQQNEAKIAYQNQLTDLQTHHQQEQDSINRDFATTLSNLSDNLFGLQNLRNSYYAQETTAAANFFSTNAAQWDNYFAQVTGMAINNLNSLNNMGQGNPIWQNGVPGHAAGLANVPSDDYLARLHKGERVLTAAENAQYSSGESRALTIQIGAVQVGEFTTPSQLQQSVDGVVNGIVKVIQQQGTYS